MKQTHPFLVEWVLLVQSVAWPADNNQLREAVFSNWQPASTFASVDLCTAELLKRREENKSVFKDGRIIRFQYQCIKQG